MRVNIFSMSIGHFYFFFFDLSVHRLNPFFYCCYHGIAMSTSEFVILGSFLHARYKVAFSPKALLSEKLSNNWDRPLITRKCWVWLSIDCLFYNSPGARVTMKLLPSRDANNYWLVEYMTKRFIDLLDINHFISNPSTY